MDLPVTCNQSEVGGKTHQRGGKVWNQNRQRVGDETRDVANMQCWRKIWGGGVKRQGVDGVFMEEKGEMRRL